MKIKHFLLFTLACLLFSLSFNSCGEEDTYTGIWNVLRNTAWKMDKTVKIEGKDRTFKFTIGFYSPVNGPYTKGSAHPHPYCVIRYYVPEGIPEWELGPGEYRFHEFDIKINRTGTRIEEWDYSSNSGSGNEQGGGTPSFPGEVEYSDGTASPKGNIRAASNLRSFGISIDEDGNSINISSVRWPDWEYDNNHASRIKGKYTKYSTDLKFAFDEDMQEFWPTIKNTTWAKQGSSTPSIGFYDTGKGPESNRYGGIGYYYLSMPDGSYISRDISGRDGLVFYLQLKDKDIDWFPRVYFSVTRSGNTLTIPQIKFPTKGWYAPPGSDDYKERDMNTVAAFDYDNQSTSRLIDETTFNNTFSGTFTLTDKVFDQGRQDLWQKVKNTAWTKSGDSSFRVGFYEGGKGPDSFYGGYYPHDYIYFKKTGNTASAPFTGINKSGAKYYVYYNYGNNRIKITSFDIAVSSDGNTLTISNKTSSGPDLNPFERYIRDYDINGTYTKTSSDPNYIWN